MSGHCCCSLPPTVRPTGPTGHCPGSGTTATGVQGWAWPQHWCPGLHPHPGLVSALADPPPRTVVLPHTGPEAEQRLAEAELHSYDHSLTIDPAQPSAELTLATRRRGPAQQLARPHCRITQPGLAAPSSTNIATCPASYKPQNIPDLRLDAQCNINEEASRN